MMKRRLACMALMALTTGCGLGIRTHEVADVTKTEIIVLRKKPGQGAIHALSLDGRGRIDGVANIALILNGESYKTEKLSGVVDFHWGGDWYSDRAEIRYTPTSATGGSLRLRYEFHG